MPNDEEILLNEDKDEAEKLVQEQVYDDSLRKSLLTEVARKKHWRERALKETESRKKLEEDNEKMKVELAKVNPPAVQNVSEDQLETILNLQSQGYSNAEILSLRKYSKTMGKTVAEIAEDSLIKAGLEAERTKTKVEQATPSPSSRTFQVQGKTWNEMNEGERKANFENMRSQFAVRGKSSSQ